MADTVAGAAVNIGLVSSLRPSPGIEILKSWRGIVEIALRATATVLAFVLIIPAGVTQTYSNGFIGVYSAAGWLLFVTIMAMLIEGVIIALRFLNLPLVEKYLLPLVITDICISFIVALGLFVGATPIATYATSLASQPAGATAAFGYFEMIAFLALGTWVLVATFVLKWCVQGKYDVTHSQIPESRGQGDDDFHHH